MDRELLLEIGCEEIPAAWLPGLTEQVGQLVTEQLGDVRLALGSALETYSTLRRLVVRVGKLGDRQTDLEETMTGPPAAAAFDALGNPTPAAVGFARKHGIDVAGLKRVATGKGEYLAVQKRQRGRPAVEVLPGVLAAVLRNLSFPMQMRWDAYLDDGRGELLFGRPIRWILYLYGGRVVPFEIRRFEVARSARVQHVRSGAVTHGHRFLAAQGRPGRALKVRTFEDYRLRLNENYVVLDRNERHDLIARALDAQASRLGGRLWGQREASLAVLREVPDLVEFPAVIAGTFPPDFLDLPEEVLTTTMIHHQHFVPLVGGSGRLMPAFLAVINTQPSSSDIIARNAERVLTARLRDARFFWDADRQVGLESRVERLDTIVFHKALGSYRAKADRLAHLARWLAVEGLGCPEAAGAAERAARLAKADLATEMVGELPELQGIMGGIYAREQGAPESVWKSIYYHYLPVAIERDAPPTRDQLGDAAIAWTAVALADKLDTVVGLFSAGEEPSGSRDPFGLRRQAQGIVRILIDLPELTGTDRALELDRLLRQAWAVSPAKADGAERAERCYAFLQARLRYVLGERGFRHDEVAAALGAVGLDAPLLARRRAEALAEMRGSSDFQALAILFKRVKNMAREISAQPQATYDVRLDRLALTEPGERALLQEFESREPRIREALARSDFRSALMTASELRPAVDRFFTEVFVMVEDRRLRTARLMLTVAVRDLVMNIADISEIGEEEVELESKS